MKPEQTFIPYRRFIDLGIKEEKDILNNEVYWKGDFWIPFQWCYNKPGYDAYKANLLGKLFCKVQLWRSKFKIKAWIYLTLYRRGLLACGEWGVPTWRDIRPLRLFQRKTKWWKVYGWCEELKNIKPGETGHEQD